MKKPFYLLLSGIVITLISGCTATMVNMAHKVDERNLANQQKGAQSFAQIEKARFEALKAKGDPDGYYFSAIAFALSQVGSKYTPENLAEIKRLYEEAVAKGSNDAKIALGKMLVTGDTLPFEVTNAALPLKDRDIERGLKLLAEGANKSCMLKQPLYQDAQCGNIRMTNAAVPIWVLYRSGRHGLDKTQGTLIKLVAIDEKLAQKWKLRRDQCKIEIQAYRKQHRCKNF